MTASRTGQPIAEVASNIALISRETLTLVGHTHVNEAMQRVSGAWISRGNGQEHLTALRSPVLTGAGACGAFLMAQDGIPLRSSGFCNVNELFDANIEQAGRIEVIKGPASVMYGSNAMHGMINVLTPPVRRERRISLEGGPHDYGRAKVFYSTDQWRVDFNGTSDGGWKDDSGFDQQKITAKHKGRLGQWHASTVVGRRQPAIRKRQAMYWVSGPTKTMRYARAIPIPKRIATSGRHGSTLA
ncbi:MAG: TonB-dependent receptor plug domain-containing protein [Gammaproteobacteria bacterium]|nr:TonB-dependent receptor plug domain-containing protein [Gammaproteobacteria bacterium]